MNAAADGIETELDLQISYPQIYPQQIIQYQVDDTPTEANYIYNGFFNNLLFAIDGSYCQTVGADNVALDPPYPDPQPGGFNLPRQCGGVKRANVISFSYGGQEFDLSMNYQIRQCNEFMKLGMEGVSLLFSSGDSGVAGPAGDDNANGCLNGTGPNEIGTVFSPDFPAGCPYITAVGATVLPPGGNAFKDEETAVTRFPSGGGFSNIYGTPSYQAAAVNTYLTQHTPPYKAYCGTNNSGLVNNMGGVYNKCGRGYPDVSAIGDNVLVFAMGAPTLVGGTSASSPLFAALINRINEELLAKGQPTVGFLNPTLYQNPGALHDITVGSNPGCGTDGFAAAKGW